MNGLRISDFGGTDDCHVDEPLDVYLVEGDEIVEFVDERLEANRKKAAAA